MRHECNNNARWGHSTRKRGVSPFCMDCNNNIFGEGQEIFAIFLK